VTPRLGIIYFFFNHLDREQTAENVTRVLLRQLLQQLETIPKDIMSERSRYQKDTHRRMPDQAKYEDLLECSIDEFFEANQNRVFILVDAYDELLGRKEVKREVASRERATVRTCLSKLTRSGHAKVLITTRLHFCPELQATFPTSKVAEVRGDLKDMTAFLNDRMQFLNLQESLKTEVINKLVTANEDDKWYTNILQVAIAVDSRFQLLLFQADHVLHSSDPIQIFSALESLPKDLTEAYNAVFDRMAPGDIEFAHRILGWILHAKKILSMSELREALAIQIGVPTLLDALKPDAIEVERVCGGLVIHNIQSGLVTFCHETVKSYLEKTRLERLPSHYALCKTCLTYLQLPLFEEGENYRTNRIKFKFGEYVATFWASHVIQCERNVGLETEIVEIFNSQGRRDAAERLGRFDHRQQSLLHFLIENRLAFIFTRPLPSHETFQHAYVTSLDSAD
jgi:hypothetical protein